jgi:urocanate hydratase
MTTNPRHNIREIRAARGTELTAKSWMTEAPLRMLMNWSSTAASAAPPAPGLISTRSSPRCAISKRTRR